MDQARPQAVRRRREDDRAFEIGRPAPHRTPSGGGHAPTPDRSQWPAAGSALEGVDSRRPVTEAPPRTVEHAVAIALEATPADATHWSTRSLARATGLGQTAVCRIRRA